MSPPNLLGSKPWIGGKWWGRKERRLARGARAWVRYPLALIIIERGSRMSGARIRDLPKSKRTEKARRRHELERKLVEQATEIFLATYGEALDELAKR